MAHAVCPYCKRTMDAGAGDTFTHFKLKDGRLVERIPYGGFGEDSEHPCHDCNVTVGQFHHLGCDNERCPICGEQAAFCDCPKEELVRINRLPKVGRSKSCRK